MNISTKPTAATATGLAALAFVIDAVLVLVFAALGRSSHDEAATIPGLWHTAWPFLIALTLTWIIAMVWRRPISNWRSGLPVWVGTVAIGLITRVLFTDGGAALPFVLVASGVLGLMFLGWRAIWAVGRRLRKDR